MFLHELARCGAVAFLERLRYDDWFRGVALCWWSLHRGPWFSFFFTYRDILFFKPPRVLLDDDLQRVDPEMMISMFVSASTART